MEWTLTWRSPGDQSVTGDGRDRRQRDGAARCGVRCSFAAARRADGAWVIVFTADGAEGGVELGKGDRSHDRE